MKKRFEFGSPDYRQGAHYSIIDNETNREMLSQNEIMNKLNELAYEKYMLEKENEQLKNRLDENAQLQKETLQQVIGKLGMEILELKDDLKKKSDVK